MSRFDNFIPWYERRVAQVCESLDPELLATRRYFHVQARVLHHIWVAEMREQIALERWKQAQPFIEYPPNLDYNQRLKVKA